MVSLVKYGAKDRSKANGAKIKMIGNILNSCIYNTLP